MRDIGLLLLRVFPGTLILLAHGWPKLMGYSERMNTFFDPIGLGSPVALALAIFAEVGCAILLILGIGTRLAAIPLLTTMLVASFLAHADDPFSKQEFPLVYGIIFLTLILTGGGRFGIGNRFRARWLHT